MFEMESGLPAQVEHLMLVGVVFPNQQGLRTAPLQELGGTVCSPLLPAFCGRQSTSVQVSWQKVLPFPGNIHRMGLLPFLGQTALQRCFSI